ncbi:inositol monophosphatase family protein [Methylobacterium goesingense]|uniref:Fructose-1,6-bisphosphatase/inositol monophosphatase family enzyme n=1 Tax=Methylobacterium goesingense TaxID=243690 RepID=A0ABV2L4N5_9HYPH|nr:inositol monophosphatase family protein [Methylobacterium goesingense]GJD72536.1 3'(2'),5'-bisphosphate nucleotidase CysQ [Methylobacterium goesingense]
MAISERPPGVVEQMLEFAAHAAELALMLRAEGLQISHKGGDLGQALTQADLAISHMLHERFGPRVIEEETAEAIGRTASAELLASADWTFVADPIDGTKPYAGGLSGWGTMIAACRNGRPEASVLTLPAWCEAHQPPGVAIPPLGQRGLLLAAYEGKAYCASTVGGRPVEELRQIVVSDLPTYHIGWLCNAAKRYTLDFERGYFPWCESGAIADTALLATGRLDATVHNHKLWDLAPAMPVFEALGFSLYRWPDLADAPPDIIDLFNAEFSAHESLWLVCRSREQAKKFAEAIFLARPEKT